MINIARLMQTLTRSVGIETDTQWKGYCPVHKGTSPAFRINLDDTGWVCFRCKAHGFNTMSLLLALEYTEEEALEMYADFSMDAQDQDLEIETRHKEDTHLLYLKEMEHVRYWYEHGFDDPAVKTDWLTIEAPEQRYLFDRGIMPQALNHFRVVLNTSLPEHRIYIPLALNGVVKGYQRRCVSDGKYRLKYLTQTGMSKSNSVYGTLEGHTALVCEGVTDMWVSWQRGVTSTVTTLGAIVSDTQMVQLYDHGIRYLILAQHHDNAGDEAYLDAKLKADEYGIQITRLDLNGDIADSKRIDFLQSYERAYQFFREVEKSLESGCK